MIRKYSLILLLLACCLPVGLWAQRAKMTALRVTGLKKLSAEEVEKYAGLERNAVVGAPELQASVDKLALSGAFQQVSYATQPVGGGYGVEFKVEEFPDWARCRFANFLWISDAEMEKMLEESNIFYHGESAIDDAMLKTISDRIVAWHKEHGREIKVKYALRFDEKEAAKAKDPSKVKPSAVVFSMDGIATPVREVSFLGAARLGDQEKKNLAKPLIGFDFDREAADLAVRDGLLSYYKRHGMLRASASAPLVRILKETPQSVDVGLTYTVQEGPVFRLSALSWNGVNSVPAKELQKIIRLQPGEIADGVALDAALDEARSLFHRYGFLDANVQVEQKLDEAAQTVAVSLSVTEGPVYTFGGLDIMGLDEATAAKLRKLWKLDEGAPYDASYVRKFYDQNTAVHHGMPMRMRYQATPDNKVLLVLEFIDKR